jgi:tRNA (cmo5U34)-methyltransferase
MNNKSSIEEIRERFDKDVERFSNLDTGQQTTIDAALTLELITTACSYTNPKAKSLLDLGCGAGNYTLKMLEKIPNLNCTLIDLSLPMLNRAKERVSKVTKGRTEMIQANIAEYSLPENEYDIVVAAAVLHHMRTEEEWEKVFKNIFLSVKSGGSFWVSDLISQENEHINQMFQEKYKQYLDGLGGEIFREKVLAYVEKEDSPRSVNFQLDLLRKVGFSQTEILHKNANFAAFGAIK